MKSINSNNFEELDRNKRIKKEFQRIIIFFEELDENQKAVINPLVQNAAFMRVTLDDLQKIISEQGPVEHYQNGAHQSGVKQSAALQSYNSLIKNYTAVVKNLISLLPPENRPPVNTFVREPESKLTEEEIDYQAQRAREVRQTAAYQQWMREQEKAGKKVTLSFNQWLDEMGE